MPQQINNCPLCNKLTKDNKVISSKGKFGSIIDMVQCQECELFYHKNYYTKEELKEYYQYFSSESMTRTVNDPIPHVEIQESRMKKKSWTSANKLELSIIQNKSIILDIGSGGGGTGRYLKNEKECIVEFIEPNKQYADMLKKEGHIVYDKFFEDVKFGKYKKYNVIIMGDVIEHLMDPVKCVEKIYNLLYDDGFFYFSTPLAPDGLIEYSEAKDPDKYAFQIPHFTIFNIISMNKLLKQFKEVSYSRHNKFDNIMAVK